MNSSLNQQIANKLREVADLLQQQGANSFRVSAYRHAATTLVNLDQDLHDVFEKEGLKGLMALPGIGKGIAAAIHEILSTGRWSQLERLRGTLDPVHLFQSVPGIGPDLAQRIHDTLHVDTLEALEISAHDGSLESVRGLGPRRAAALRAALANMLGRVHDRKARALNKPEVKLLLDVDREYLERSRWGELPTIAPKRLNPEGKSWLPVLHTRRAEWHLTAMFSNTARAHELGRIKDWVVLFSYDDHHREGQNTVVTETQGTLRGKRVVRGREPECMAYYAGLSSQGMQEELNWADTEETRLAG